MSVDQLPTKPAAKAAGGTKLVQYDQYIDQQVESTRRVVKLVDLATSLVVLVAGVLAYLLVVAVAEHWIVPGGFPFAVRVALFALLVCGVGYYAVRRVWPLVIGKINPVYAAQAIEQTGPSLKNSLVNLLLFRQKRTEISDAVYKTLEEQAAQRLSRVPVDAAVDRTTLIRFGYVLIAIVAVAGLYKVFSPKDPVISAKRVLMPWANIVPASRVTIDAIEPGEVTVSRGENLVVSAEVRGVGDDDAVVLKYTTRDGRAVDKRLNMKLTPDGVRYEGRLPKEEGNSADAGLSESLTYRIEAGDARSLDYAVTVVPSPSILVERIDYDYPQYTGFVDRTVEGLGDIRAIEGTRVTIHARANGPIAEAHVDFDADGRRETLMTARDGNASASFVLELRDDRTTPKHASYVLRFMNAERRSNINPVKHSIGVDPDYAPEASIIAPREEVLDVRLDETVAIEVEARDPDFAIADVRLHGEVAGRSLVDERLLTTGPKKRFESRYQFTPKAHNLRAGDTVQYWIAASDNKSPSPNTVLTKKQVLRIVSPDPAQQPPPDRLAQRDQQQRQQPSGRQGEQQEQQGQQGEKQSQDGGGGKQQGEQQQGGQGGEQQKGEQQQGEQQGHSSEGGANSQQQNSRDAQRDQQQQGEGQPGQGGEQQQSEQREQQGGESQGGESQAGGENSGQQQDGQSGKQQQPGQQGGQSGERQQQGGSKQQDGSNSNSKQTGAGAAGGEPSEGAQPDGARPDSKQGKPSANGGQSKGGQQQPAEAEQLPVSSEGDDDAEAFDRIQKHLQRDGQLKDDPAASKNQEQGQGEGETGKQGDQKQSATEQNADGKSQQKQGDAEQPSEGQKSQQSAGEKQQQDQGAEQKPGAEQTGDQSSDAKSAQEQTGEKGEESQSQGGEQANTQGEPGAGNEKESQGAPNSQTNMKQGEKREQQGSQGEQSNKQEPPAGGRGKKESDSQGEEGGDRAGGGEEGGGQRAPREGTGSAGQNQSADEGGGASDEKGQGVDSSSPGQDSASDNQEGTPGGEAPGRGRKVKRGEGEDPGGTEPGEKPDGEQQQNAEPGKQAEDTGSNRGAPTGQGGNQGSEGTPAPRDGGTVPEGDKANLDYARERTDLVLEKLSDQLKRKKIDEKMLKQLGWTEDDLRTFIARWEARKRAAEQNDAAGEQARRELDDALRSLGLRRGPMQTNRVQDDQMRDLKEGYRGPVPLEYQERLRAYNQGVSRAQESE